MTFYLLDNLAILSKLKVLHIKYDFIKILAYNILLIGLLSALAYYLVKLRSSFKKESELKSIVVNNMTPREFC